MPSVKWEAASCLSLTILLHWQILGIWARRSFISSPTHPIPSHPIPMTVRHNTDLFYYIHPVPILKMCTGNGFLFCPQSTPLTMHTLSKLPPRRELQQAEGTTHLYRSETRLQPLPQLLSPGPNGITQASQKCCPISCLQTVCLPRLLPL